MLSPRSAVLCLCRPSSPLSSSLPAVLCPLLSLLCPLSLVLVLASKERDHAEWNTRGLPSQETGIESCSSSRHDSSMAHATVPSEWFTCACAHGLTNCTLAAQPETAPNIIARPELVRPSNKDGALFLIAFRRWNRRQIFSISEHQGVPS